MLLGLSWRKVQAMGQQLGMRVPQITCRFPRAATLAVLSPSPPLLLLCCHCHCCSIADVFLVTVLSLLLYVSRSLHSLPDSVSQCALPDSVAAGRAGGSGCEHTERRQYRPRQR